MAKPDLDNMPKVTVRLAGSEDANEICHMLRGLLYANKQSDGHRKSNQQFERGVTITFGAAPFATLFVAAVGRLFRARVRRRLTLEQHA